MMFSFFKGEQTREEETAAFAKYFGLTFGEAENIVAQYAISRPFTLKDHDDVYYFPRNVLITSDSPLHRICNYSPAFFSFQGHPDLLNLRTHK